MRPVTDTDTDTTAMTAERFLALLCEHRRQCGKPTLQKICDLSVRLPEIYGREHRFESLSVTTVSEILNGRRAPRWERVRAFVLACNRYAFESGGLEQDPGLRVLPEWQARFAAISAADPAGHAEQEQPASATESDAMSEPQPRVEPHPDQELVLRVLLNLGLIQLRPEELNPEGAVDFGTLLDQVRHRTTDPVAVTAQRYRQLFGHPHVVELLFRAHEDSDTEAAGRLAVLLLCAGRSDEAGPWLERAAHGGEVIAQALLHAEPPYRRGLAIEFAHELALVEANRRDAGRLSTGRMARLHAYPLKIAELYGMVAARCGHKGAAFWLAERHLVQDDLVIATYWNSIAAEHGHDHADTQLGEISARIRRANESPMSIAFDRTWDGWRDDRARRPDLGTDPT